MGREAETGIEIETIKKKAEKGTTNKNSTNIETEKDAENEAGKDILKFAVRAGELMLSNGAETYRVEDTMERILLAFQLKTVECFVTTTGIFSCIDDSKGELLTMVRRVRDHTINLDKVSQINDLSRRLVERKVSFQEAKQELSLIERIQTYHPALLVLASGVSCFGFCFMYGGTLLDSIASLLIGILLYLFVLFLRYKKSSSFILNILGGIVIGSLSLIFTRWGPGQNMDRVIVGAIMPLIPGLGFTNAIRDVLKGDFMSGLCRITDALIIAVSIAAGVGIVLKLFL